MPSKEKKTPRNKADAASEAVTRKWQGHPVLYIFSFALLVVIVVTFIGAPVMSKVSESVKLEFGSYAGKPIAYVQGNYFARQRDNIADQVNASQQNEDVEQLALRVWRSAFESTAFHMGILDLAEKSGMYVTEDRVDEYLVNYPGYQENGRFSELRYRNTPSAERFTIRKLSRESIVQEQYMEDVISGQLENKAEVEFIKTMITPERKVRYAYFSIGDYPAAELVAFAQNNAKLFDRMTLSRISISSSEADARKIHEKLTADPTKFAETAKASSTDSFAESGGSMGERYYYQLQGQFTSDTDVDTVFALDKGAVSPVIKTADGWAVYRADEAKQAPDYSSEETLSSIRSYMTIYERGIMEDYMVKKAEAFKTAAATADFNTEAIRAGMKTGTTDFFPINMGPIQFFRTVRPETESEESPVLDAVSSSEQFFTKVFSLPQDGVTDPIVAGEYVLVAQLIESRDTPAENTDNIQTFYTYLDQQYRQQAVYGAILSSPKLEDNFYEVYAKYFFNQ